jgi:hypothetical protein
MPSSKRPGRSLVVDLWADEIPERLEAVWVNNDDSNKAFIRRIFHNTKQAFAADNERSAFVQIGVSSYIDAVLYCLIFDESTHRQSQGFLTLWHSDYPLEHLSIRRRSARFGWVNREMRNNWIE